MPTIPQLPSADTVSASDLIPISQGGSVHSISVGALLAQTQPAIVVEPPSLLGRISVGPGGPDTIAIGEGLSLNNGTLSSGSFSLANLPRQTSFSPSDQIVVTNAGASLLVGLPLIRELFSAGSNITIDATGVISASALGSATTYSLAALSAVAILAPEDLVWVSKGGQDHTITYANLLDGVTIDLAAPAEAAADNDAIWVAQTNNIMLRQTLGALWPWVSGKLPSWKRPVIELSVNTTLDGAVHNNAVLVCSSPILISASIANLGSGFSCEVINTSSGLVTFSGNILASNGTNGLAQFQWSAIHCVTYSGGTTVFASISAGGSATVTPGPISHLTASALTSTSITLSWSAPTSGGQVSVYSVNYRITGTISWLAAGQTTTSQTFTIGGLTAATSYDFTVSAINNIGAGPISTSITSNTPANNLVPGTPTAITVGNITANSIACSWTAPTIGDANIVYAVQYKASGEAIWSSAASNLAVMMFTINNLLAGTTYFIQITASNGNGSGPPSAAITAQTALVVGLVTSLIWNAVPIGNFTIGTGAIGVNVHVNPPTAAVQFGFSTSPTSPPTTWVAGAHVNSDLWGQFVPTPVTAGSWYAWAEGTDGSAATVCVTPFTVT